MPPREEAAAEKKEKRNRPWLTIVLLALVLLLSGGYIYHFFFGVSSPAATAVAGRNPAPAIMQKLTLEPIVVNLADPGLHRYLRAKITLEYNEPKLTAELNDKVYRVRDTIISVLRSKKTGDLESEDALKRELLAAINAQLLAGQISALYFEEFIVQ